MTTAEITIAAILSCYLIANTTQLIAFFSPNLFNPVGNIQLLFGYANLADFVNSNVNRIYISHDKNLKIKWITGVKGVYPVRHVIVKILNSDDPNREHRFTLRELYKILFRINSNFRPLKK